MRRQITYAFLALLFFSLHVSSMEDTACPVANLPDELLVSIFHHENSYFERIVHLELVCSKWRELINTEEFWKQIYIEKFGIENKTNEGLTFKEHLFSVLLFSHASQGYELANRELPCKAKNIRRSGNP